jgi:hypothetical protein
MLAPWFAIGLVTATAVRAIGSLALIVAPS